jgi:phospholipid/cholesterol/gamma-HCH transport system substrate-binding protein
MTRRREVLVGIVIVAGVFVAVFGTLWLQDAGLGRGTVEVEALVAEVGALMNGNSVKLRGVNIGRVSRIAVEPGGEAVRVTMRIQDNVQLPPDPVVILAPESLFGDWQAEILSRGAYPHFRYYESGDPEVMGGHALPDISRLTAAADQISATLAILTSRVEQTFTEETARNISLAIDNIQEVSERLRELVEVQAGAFSNLAAEVESAAVELGGAASTANVAFQRVEEILGAPGTDEMLADAQAAVGNIRALLEELRTTAQGAQGMVQNADSTFARLDRLMAQIEAGEGAFGHLMKDESLAVRAQDALLELQALLADLKENPQRYVRISIF